MRLQKSIILPFKTSILMVLALTIITGVIYPFFVTILAQLLFPWQANGSLIQVNNQIIGSALIGQYFNAPNYFWGRPSMTQSFPYNALSSSGSNLASSNPIFLDLVKNRISHLQTSSLRPGMLVPIELVTASGSGLDPHISPEAAFYQSARIAAVRHLPEATVRTLIENMIQPRSLGFLGEPRVNVLELNIALDHLRMNNDRQSPKS